jgi:SAM-dependent methyltransferase
VISRTRARAGVLRRWLAHPLARDLDPDAAHAPQIHRRILASKPLLRDVYDEWYAAIAAEIGAATPVVELGSGAGYLQARIPHLITSDVRPTPAARLVFDAHRLPFRTATIGAIVMTNVVHHLSHVSEFLDDAARVTRPGGVMVMVEPWVSRWSRWIYRNFHHEPFDPDVPDWEFPRTGPLSSANGALPWMMFSRDRTRFERTHRQWTLQHVRPGWPMRYLLSGGVSLRTMMPSAARGVLRTLDRTLPAREWAMFALIVLRRTEPS